MKDSREIFLKKAHGKVLMVGFHSSLLLQLLQNPKVEDIVIIDKKEILVEAPPRLFRSKVHIIHANIFDYQPTINQKFNVIYFDIWCEVRLENLEEINKLHRRFRLNLDRTDPDCWMDSWMREYLLKWRHEDRRTYQYF